MLTQDQIDLFHRDGFVRVKSAVYEAEVAEMHGRLSALLRARGADPDDPSTWRPGMGCRLQAIRKDDVAPHEGSVVRSALDQYFGAGRWRTKRHWGQALVTPPSERQLTLPKGPWHLDYPYWFPHDAIWGMNVFLFVAAVRPRGGGTLAVRSSNRLVARFAAEAADLGAKQSELTRQFRVRFPWFRSLAKAGGGPREEEERIAAFMDNDTDVDGVGVRVVEMTGQPGDVVFCHPWLVHASSPNVQPDLRIMRALRVYRARVDPG